MMTEKERVTDSKRIGRESERRVILALQALLFSKAVKMFQLRLHTSLKLLQIHAHARTHIYTLHSLKHNLRVWSKQKRKAQSTSSSNQYEGDVKIEVKKLQKLIYEVNFSANTLFANPSPISYAN